MWFARQTTVNDPPACTVAWAVGAHVQSVF